MTFPVDAAIRLEDSAWTRLNSFENREDGRRLYDCVTVNHVHPAGKINGLAELFCLVSEKSVSTENDFWECWVSLTASGEWRFCDQETKLVILWLLACNGKGTLLRKAAVELA